MSSKRAQNIIEIVERRYGEDRRQLVLHGTSTVFLRSILKKCKSILW